jgi:hypothetical protein
MVTMNANPPREFLLKQIENEINAGFVLVEAARKAYKISQFVEADSALAKALKAHTKTLQHASESDLDHVRSITHQLKELREAINWLLESHLELAAKKNR